MELLTGDRWLEIVADPILDKAGAPCGAVHIISDITERKRVEAEIQKLNAELEQRVRDRTAQLQTANVQLQSEIVERALTQAKLAERTRQLETLTDNAPDLIFRVDRALRYVYVNPRMSEASGLSREACIGMTNAEMGLPAELARLWDDAYSEVLGTARPKEFAFVFPATAGPRNCQARLVPEFAADGTVETVLGLTRDVTDLRRSAERLRQIEHLASIGTLAAGIAHEINNPVGAMRLAAQNALSYLGEPLDRPALHQCLNDIVEDARRCGQIIKNVLRFAKEEPLEKTPGDLTEVVRRAADIARPLAEERQVVLEWTGERLELPSICLNATAMLQALVNIIQNAIEASPRDGRVRVWLKQVGGVVRIAVQDQGPGLTAEQQRHMFDPFYTTRRQQGGSGLGLSIVHGIIGDHRGSIDVDSRPAHGTTVTITLPLGP
jgi:PAS domain S-box-containing protein